MFTFALPFLIMLMHTVVHCIQKTNKDKDETWNMIKNGIVSFERYVLPVLVTGFILGFFLVGRYLAGGQLSERM